MNAIALAGLAVGVLPRRLGSVRSLRCCSASSATRVDACAGPEPPTPGSVCAWGQAPCCGAPALCVRMDAADCSAAGGAAAGSSDGRPPVAPTPAGHGAQRLRPAGPAGGAARAPPGAPPGELAQGPCGARRRRQPHLPSVLLRLVDDVLVITPSRATAEALALRLLQGARPPPRELCTAWGAPEHPGLCRRWLLLVFQGSRGATPPCMQAAAHGHGMRVMVRPAGVLGMLSCRLCSACHTRGPTRIS